MSGGRESRKVNHFFQKKAPVINNLLNNGFRAAIAIGSMYGIFTYICLISMVNVGKYTIPMDSMGLK